MPRERTLTVVIVILTLGLFGVFILRDARAGGKKDELPPPPPVFEKKDGFIPPPVLPPVGKPVVPAPIKTTSLWTFSFEMKDGRMHLSAKTSGHEYKVICDSLDLQAPRGQVIAQGGVLVESSDVNAKGEKLTIAFGEDRLLLEGKAEVNCRAAGAGGVELSGERFSLRHGEARKERKGKEKW